MTTKGNLELRFNETTLCASTLCDGYRTYEAVPKLVDFLDSVKNPTKEQLSKWFRSMSKKLLPSDYSETLIGGVPNEVIMDIPRRLILHNGVEDTFESVSKGFPDKFENACIILKTKYDYEILRYVRQELRTFLKDQAALALSRQQ